MEGVAVVDDDAGLAAGSEDAVDLAERGGHVGGVVEDAVGGDAVEALVGEWELLGVTLDGVAFESECGEWAFASSTWRGVRSTPVGWAPARA